MAIYNGDISVSANFQLNINKPLDTRTVVDNVTDLSNISFKYQGMLVYIKNDDKYYSYNGTIWNELSTGGSVGGNFVDLTTNQDIDGTKSFLNDLSINGVIFGTKGDVSSVAIGHDALVATLATTSSYNTAIGAESLFSTTTGLYNTATGGNSLYSNIDGWLNTAVGFNSMYSLIGGFYNTAIGAESLYDTVSGQYNTAIGYRALAGNNIDGNSNTAIGYNAGIGVNFIYNSTAIGANAILTTSDTILLGDENISMVKTSGNLVSGTITYPNTDGTANQVIGTDGNGVLSWVEKDANINAYKTIFVDAVNGNDSTAVNYDISKRYATIKEALANATSNDTVYVFPGLYDEYNIAPVNNVTLYLSENTIIQPSTNSGNVPVITDLAIPSWWTVLYSMEMNFKIRGKGKILNTGATAQYNNTALMLVLAKSRWDVELDTLSSYQIYGGSALIIKNTKITLSGCAFRHSIQVRPSVVHIDCEFQNAHIGLIPLGTLGLRHMSFKRCKFIRTVEVSEFDSLITGTDTVLWDSPLGLDTIKYPNVSVGHHHGSCDEFIECEFYNYVGGDNIVLGDSQTTNTNFVVRDCRFTNTNTDLSRGIGVAIKIRGGLTVPTNLYLYNNIADTIPVYDSSPLSMNLVPGDGMIIAGNDMGIAYYNRLIGTRNWN